MIHNKIPTNIGQYLRYNPESTTGLSWILSKNFKIKIGSYAGYIRKTERDIDCLVEFDNIQYKCSRIIWFLLKNQDPADLVVDHIDGNTKNNKIEELNKKGYGYSERHGL